MKIDNNVYISEKGFLQSIKIICAIMFCFLYLQSLKCVENLPSVQSICYFVHKPISITVILIQTCLSIQEIKYRFFQPRHRGLGGKYLLSIYLDEEGLGFEPRRSLI